jgi:hypothetical protein
MSKELVVWIEQTREQAITLAHDVGNDAEVHALHIRKGTFGFAEKPVGYLVYIPPKWVGLSEKDADSIECWFREEIENNRFSVQNLIARIEAKLKEKNHE